MSLFDLQDVRIAIGSIATLDLPMVVDLIGIYGLKGPYYTLTTTSRFLQALSVIPRGSWGDPPPPSSQIAAVGRRPTPSPSSPKIRSGQFDEENPSAQISSGLLVQADEGVSNSVVDLIGVITAVYREVPFSLRNRSEPGTSCQQGFEKQYVKKILPKLNQHGAALRAEQITCGLNDEKLTLSELQ
ncbi:transcription factor GAMYB-like [Dorcoceras hygrometricum]|uniref:Transcription factor GAMYB-like n=1 Tax=Dorcoceras hygrometricum TaxID=472368 RepID=A0A2Z7AIH4_9LAMI|nr:transcription factor GAMYB-like [Dorcoceras hygrometricum]